MRTRTRFRPSPEELAKYEKVLEIFKGKPLDKSESEDKTRLLFVGYGINQDFQVIIDTKTKKILFSRMGGNKLNIKSHYSISNMFIRDCELPSYDYSIFDRKITMIGSELSLLVLRKSIASRLQSIIKVLYLKNKLVKLLT